jgi:hypothetical protein
LGYLHETASSPFWLVVSSALFECQGRELKLNDVALVFETMDAGELAD